MCLSFKKKQKKRYRENLNEKSVVENNLFWKIVKPLLSNNVVGKDEIHLTEDSELVKADL